uniref:Uncharacterized protein n=1 Tax=Aegilops tauschii subsp. strangulata TaxID=200361 RepID=A0A453MEI4_AEGTS
RPNQSIAQSFFPRPLPSPSPTAPPRPRPISQPRSLRRPPPPPLPSPSSALSRAASAGLHQTTAAPSAPLREPAFDPAARTAPLLPRTVPPRPPAPPSAFW